MKTISIGQHAIPLWLVVTLVLSGVFGTVVANYVWHTVVIDLEVEEPLKILHYPKKLNLYPGETKEFNVTIKNSASRNYTVILHFSLDNTTYQDNYVTFSNETYTVIPNKQNLTAWLQVEEYAPPIETSLTIDFHRIAEEEGLPFSDEFNTSTLDSRWTAVDPDLGSSFDLTANSGWLRITTTSPPERDLIGTWKVNAPRIIQSVSGDFTVETKVMSTMDENDEGAGILVWKDSSNYLRLERISRTIGYPVEPQIIFVGTIGGVWSMHDPQHSSPGGVIHLPSDLNPTYLKLSRSGNVFSGYYSSDGITWTHVADMPFPVNDPINLGLSIINVYHSGTFFADFDYFRVEEKELLFFDDFNDGVADGWTPQRGYTWEVIDGEYVSSLGGGRAISIVDDLTFTNGVIKAMVRHGEGNPFQDGIVFRYLDDEHYYSFFISDEYDEVRLRIHNESDSHYGNCIIDWGKYPHTGGPHHGGGISYPINPDTIYHLEIRINGNNFTGYVNDEKILSGIDDSYEAGSVGLSAHRGTVYFDNFTVYSLP